VRKRKIGIENAAGKMIPHDLTKIVPGTFKGPAFKKGHIIKKEDIPSLLKIGKEKIWVLEISKDEYHEDEAAEKFRLLAGKNVGVVGPSEGKITFFAEKDGLLLVNRKSVDRINAVKDVVLATRHSFVPVKKREEIAGIRIVPLVTKKDNAEKVLKECVGSRPFSVVPFEKKRCALIVTGSEVAKGRIKDKFRPVIEKKLKAYGSSVNFFKIITDDAEFIEKAVTEAKKKCGLIILTGGMSVDPDDVTRLAVKRAGAKVVSYGAPVLPGNMFLTAYIGEIPVMGVPACALFYKITVFDLFLPMALAGLKITKKNILSRGYGGYCAHCRVCVFPDCQFGKC